MKLHLITIKRRHNKRGETLVQIAISQNQDTAYISTGISVPFDKFDSKNLVHKSVPGYEEINAKLNMLLNQYRSIALYYTPFPKNFTVIQVKAKLLEEWARRYGSETTKKKVIKAHKPKAVTEPTPAPPVQQLCEQDILVYSHPCYNYDMWKDRTASHIFPWLVRNAHSDKTPGDSYGRPILRGDVEASYSYICQCLGYDVKSEINIVRGAIDRLIKKGYITKKTTNETTKKTTKLPMIITICNYDSYNWYKVIPSQSNPQSKIEQNHNNILKEDIIKEKEFSKGMWAKYPKLMGVRKALTYDQYVQLCNEFPAEHVISKIQAIEKNNAEHVECAYAYIRHSLKKDKK